MCFYYDKIVKSLLVELDSRFLFHEVLDAFGIIYFQYWIQEEIDVSIIIHLGGFKVALCRFLHDLGYKTRWSVKLSYWNPFGFNISLVARFVETHNESPNKGCHWCKLIHSIVVYNFKLFRMFCHNIFKYVKLAEIGSVFVLGSVEDERCFSSLKFLKSNFQNRLNPHLPMVVRIF